MFSTPALQFLIFSLQISKNALQNLYNVKMGKEKATPIIVSPFRGVEILCMQTKHIIYILSLVLHKVN